MHWYSWVIGLLVSSNLYVLYRAIIIQMALTQSLLDNQVALSMMKTMKEEIENSSIFKDETNENFIKFLSESREWAFEYIENTISVVNNVIEECRKEMNKPRIADLNTTAFLAGVIGKLLPIVQNNKDGKDV